MKKYIIVAGLLLAMSGIGAVAQTSTTPGVPEPTNPSPPTPQASAPDQQNSSDRDRSSSDQQQYPDAKRDQDQNGQYNDQNQPNQSQDEDNARRDRDNQDQNQAPQSDHSPDPHAYSHNDSSYRDQIQSALQQSPGLSGVNVDEAESRIVLSGSVASEGNRAEAERIAQSYAHGREVVDRIAVSGVGSSQR
ncbi:MAG TPA: BON domain-containing protein [Terriglobales bacterium]|nr:BON domain-containing protein [Terriglobales bacterium]